MSFSVTKNVSVVTDMLSLLSSVGFEPGGEAHLELVIDQFEQWCDATRGSVYATCVGSGVQIAA